MSQNKRDVVANFRMTREDANRLIRLSKRFPTSRAALTLRCCMIGVEMLEKDASLFSVKEEEGEKSDVE